MFFMMGITDGRKDFEYNRMIVCNACGAYGRYVVFMTYTVLSEEPQDDGTILCKLEITAIDMEALLEDLPDDLGSNEEAREEMLEMAENAERKTFEAELILVPAETESGYAYQYGNDFVNAVTGGMLDLIIEAYDLEVAE